MKILRYMVLEVLSRLDREVKKQVWKKMGKLEEKEKVGTGYCGLSECF